MRDHWFLNIVGLDELLPCCIIETENGLMSSCVLLTLLCKSTLACANCNPVSTALHELDRRSLTKNGKSVFIQMYSSSGILDEKAHVEEVLNSLPERMGVNDERKVKDAVVSRDHMLG